MNKKVTELDSDLPTYFKRPTVSQPSDDKQVELVTLELTSLPKYIDEFDFRKVLSQASHHIVDIQTQKDNITGFCTGKGRV